MSMRHGGSNAARSLRPMVALIALALAFPLAAQTQTQAASAPAKRFHLRDPVILIPFSSSMAALGRFLMSLSKLT